MTLQTEFEFTLPMGYVDREGTLHKGGRMRLATAMDEIAPLRDPRVQGNQAYMVIVLLARVITQLGSLTQISANMVENFFAADLAYLQSIYRRVNEEGRTTVDTHCPDCQAVHQVDLADLGGQP